MRKSSFHPSMLLIFAVCIITASSHAQSPSSWGYSQYVAPPAIPDKLDFAGEKVPVENIDTRESLQREMLVTLYMHASTQVTLLNMKRYFAIIEPILRRNNIPEDFKYLCVAESGLNPEAVSSAGAAGLWQLMPFTGKELGLEVGSEVDERHHIEKSTGAACAYLRKSYERFGSWTLVAAAYNLGNEGVARRITRQGVSSYYDVYVPLETLRYVFRILSWKLIMGNPAAYGYHIKQRDYYPVLTDCIETEVNDLQVEWPAVAARGGTTYKLLRLLNPWIRGYSYKNVGGKTLRVIMPAPQFRQYTVKAGGRQGNNTGKN